MLRERWPPWKAGLYGLEMVLPQGRYFQTGGLVYDIQSVYLIYAGLLVHATLNLVYSKEYVYYMLLSYAESTCLELYSYSDITFQPYKPIFLATYLMAVM